MEPSWTCFGQELCASTTLLTIARLALLKGETMDVIERSPTEAKWHEALQCMEAALDTLDVTGAPPDIGSHLDLAICRLECALGRGATENSIHELQGELERALADGATADGGVSDSGIWAWPPRLDTQQLSAVTGHR
jgi:hypothetical protein